MLLEVIGGFVFVFAGTILLMEVTRGSSNRWARMFRFIALGIFYVLIALILGLCILILLNVGLFYLTE